MWSNSSSNSFFEEIKEEIEILAYRVNCPFCLKFLEEPTPEEVKNAIIIKREKQTAHSQGFGENAVLVRYTESELSVHNA